MTTMQRTLNMFDEGLVLVDARRIAAGDLIHHDFYSIYGPGSYYVLAGLFKLSGYEFLIGRLYGAATMAGVVAATFRLLAGRVRLRNCLAFTGICTLWMVATPYYLYPLFPCLLLALIGTAVLLGPGALRFTGALAFAGAMAGLSALLRYDAGFFLLVANLVGVAVVLALQAPHAGSIKAFIRAALIYGLASAAVFLPFAVAYLASAPISGFWADIVDYPLNHYVEMRGLPFPRRAILHNFGEAGVYFPIAAAALGLWEAAAIRRKRRTAGVAERMELDRTLAFIVMFTLLTTVFYYKGIVRVSSLHMLMSIIPACILASVAAEHWWRRHARPFAVALLVVFAATAPPVFAAHSRLVADLRAPGGTFSGWLWSGGVAAERCDVPAFLAPAHLAPDYAAVSAYLRRYSAPGEPILIALDRHDKIFLNPVALYFAADRPPGTHWHQFDPGLQTRADIQRAIIADLARNRVKWVVRDASFSRANEPNASSRSSGVYLLDRHLAAHYRPVARAGLVEIWLERSAAPPRLPAGTPCLPKPLT